MSKRRTKINMPKRQSKTDQLQARIDNLERELELRDIGARIQGAAGAATGSAVEAEIRQLQRDRDYWKTEAHRWRQVANNLSPFAPWEIAGPPEDERALEAEAESRGAKLLKTTIDRACPVCVTVSVRADLTEPHFEVGRVYGMFPGSIKEAEEELLEYITALVWRAPFRDNLRSRSIPSVDDDTLLLALHDVADWWHIEDFRHNYHDRLKGVFNHHLKPHVDFGAITNDMAYDYWRKTVEDTFANMAQNGRGRGDKPRQRKSSTKFTKTTLSRNPS